VQGLFNFIAPKVAGLPFPGAFGSMYFPGIKSFVQGDIPFLDGEVPAANGVLTGRGLAKMYVALANEGSIDGKAFLSPELARGLAGRPKVIPDLNMVVPMPFHLWPGRCAAPSRPRTTAARSRCRATARPIPNRLGAPRLSS
jgi:hypothetical protein